MTVELITNTKYKLVEQNNNTFIPANELLINVNEYAIKLNKLDVIPTSNFLLSTIYFWNNISTVHFYTLPNAILLVQFKPPFGNAFAHLLCHEITEPLMQIAKNKTKELGINKLNITFNETVANNYLSLNLMPEIDDFEYVYRLNDLSLLMGSKYKKQRNAYAKAIKENNELTIKIENLSNIENKEELKEFCLTCLQIKTDKVKANNVNLLKEWDAFQQCMELENKFNLKIIKLYANQKLSGILIYEELNSEWIVGHFLKSLNGLGIYLLSELSTYLAAQNFKYFNFQEDRGVETLRYFKQQLNPAFQLKTYSIVL